MVKTLDKNPAIIYHGHINPTPQGATTKVFYTIQTAAEALEQIIAQAESDSLTDQPVSNETIHLLRQALYAVQAEEAIEEANA